MMDVVSLYENIIILLIYYLPLRLLSYRVPYDNSFIKLSIGGLLSDLVFEGN